MRTLFMLALMAAPATAMEWSDFDTLTGDQQAAYLIGAGSAYEFANAHATLNGYPEIYCTGTVDRAEFVRIASDYRQDGEPVELSLMLGLQAEFPCDE